MATSETSTSNGLSGRIRDSLALAQTRIHSVEERARALGGGLPGQLRAALGTALSSVLEQVAARVRHGLDLPSRSELAGLMDRLDDIDRKLAEFERARAAGARGKAPGLARTAVDAPAHPDEAVLEPVAEPMSDALAAPTVPTADDEPVADKHSHTAPVTEERALRVETDDGASEAKPKDQLPEKQLADQPRDPHEASSDAHEASSDAHEASSEVRSDASSEASKPASSDKTSKQAKKTVRNTSASMVVKATPVATAASKPAQASEASATGTPSGESLDRTSDNASGSPAGKTSGTASGKASGTASGKASGGSSGKASGKSSGKKASGRSSGKRR